MAFRITIGRTLGWITSRLRSQCAVESTLNSEAGLLIAWASGIALRLEMRGPLLQLNDRLCIVAFARGEVSPLRNTCFSRPSASSFTRSDGFTFASFACRFNQLGIGWHFPQKMVGT